MLRDAKRMHFLWQPTPAQQEAIDKCADVCLPQGETEQFLKGWSVTSVNEWGVDQERIFLLTDRRCYRVKFDYDTKQEQPAACAARACTRACMQTRQRRPLALKV